METAQSSLADSSQKNTAIKLPVFLSFGVLGSLTVYQQTDTATMILFFVLGVLYAWVSMFLIGLVLKGSGGIAHQTLINCINGGFLALIPFSILALIAELYLGWSAVQVFTSAGIMAAVSAVGMEISKHGNVGKIATFTALGTGLVLSFVWLIGTSLLASLF